MPIVSPFRKPLAKPVAAAPVKPVPAPAAPIAYTSDPRFNAALAFTWRVDEDGQPLHVTPGDRGGATAWGVTLAAWASWREDHGDRTTTEADLAAATKPQLADMIRSRYWLAVSADSLPVGVDLLVYDFGYGSGTGTSVRVLQGVVGVDADGVLGPRSLAAIAAHDRIALIKALSTRHEAYYQGLSDFALFGRGWTRRNSDRTALALTMSEATPAAAA